jgi:hypothetical protein
MNKITADDITTIIETLAKDEDLLNRVIDATEQLNTHRPHDGHALEQCTVETLAEDIALAAAS